MTTKTLSPLEMNDKLMQAAQIRAGKCTIQFSHTRLDGTLFNADLKMWKETLPGRYVTVPSRECFS